MFRVKILIGLAVVLLAGCQPAETAPTGLPSPIPWATSTPSPTQSIPTPAVSSTPSPAPSPTPILYKVKSGDTFSSIAGKYGITIDALRAANPKVQELFLSIGQELIISAGTGTPLPAQPTPAPAPLALEPARCYPQLNGGRWCLAMVANPGPDTVEGIRVRFFLYESAGAEPVAAQETVLAPDSLAAGERAPAAAYFAPSDPGGAAVRAEVTGATAAGGEEFAVPLTVLSQEATALEGGLEIVFSIRIAPTAAVPARRLQAVATLLDAAGRPVGFRRLEAAGEWKPGDTAQFSLRVYSLGADTGRFELVVRAYPDAPEIVTPTLTPTPRP
jgi:LysM repeat protein